jgi:Lar family restriction alleviation protein
MPAANHAHKHQLKPCPFCGSADLTLGNLGQCNDWFVNCNICEVQMIADYSEALAVAMWNKRVSGRDADA